MARSAPCLPRHGTRQKTQTLLANGLKSHTLKSNTVGVAKRKPRSRGPATRKAAKNSIPSQGHLRTVDHSFKAPESDKPPVELHKPPPVLHTHAQALLAPVKIQKLAQKWAAKAISSTGKTRAAQKTHKASAPGHMGVNTAEHVYSFKEPEDKPEIEIQNAVGGAALTSATPTALSSHMDPRLLQAASGIQGTGLMGVPQDSVDVSLDGQETPISADPTKFDAAVLATHPEQIGEGEMEEEEEERIPSDPMKVKLIDAPVEQVDGNPAPLPLPTPTLALPPQLTLPQASSAPPPEDSSEAPSSPGPMSPGAGPQLGAPPMQTSQLAAPPLPTTPMGAPPQGSQLGTLPPPVSQMSAPAYSYESYDSSPYGENLYNQQPGYDPLQMQDQYHMSAPLLDSGNPDHMSYYPQPFPSRYPQNHKSYYHFSQMNNPDRYNFTKAVQNYDRASHNDGMYCYSCIMFFGVLMIGCGIIMIIVELFDLFGKHKNMPLAIAGGGVLALGIIVLAGSMLLWRRRRSNIKKKAAHV